MITVFFIFLAAVVGLALVVMLIFELCVFICSLILKRNDIADVAWGASFLAVVLTFFFVLNVSTTQLKLLVVLIMIWGIRLVFHIGTRFFAKDEEDPRYAQWRKDWKWFKTRSFFQVYLLQGVLMVIILAPVLGYIAAPGLTPYWLITTGLLLWVMGFLFEVVGDWQLGQFIKDPSKYGLERGDLMTKGLWSITRHPNYFGEMSMWWGIWLICLYTFNPYYMAVTIIGPITITILLTLVSGVRMTERHWANKYGDKFEEYKNRVPALIPWKYLLGRQD